MKEYGTNIRIQEPVAGDRPAVYASYDKPTSLPQNMKVMSMQWLGPDHKPMGIYDKFEIGKEYTLNLRIGFEGGEEKGQVYSKNWEEFKVNGKSVTAWMLDVDFTDGHVWEMNHSYKVVDPSAVGTLSGTVKSYNSATDPVTVQMFRSGSYTMKVSKKNHVTREYTITVGTQTVTARSIPAMSVKQMLTQKVLPRLQGINLPALTSTATVK